MAKTNRIASVDDVKLARKAFIKFKGRSDRKTSNRQAVLESIREDEVLNR